MAQETVYSATKTFDSIGGQRVLSVDANGGTVTVEAAHGAEWIAMKVYSADAVEVIDFGYNRSYRFTPAGGATYAL